MTAGHHFILLRFLLWSSTFASSSGQVESLQELAESATLNVRPGSVGETNVTRLVLRADRMISLGGLAIIREITKRNFFAQILGVVTFANELESLNGEIENNRVGAK